MSRAHVWRALLVYRDDQSAYWIVASGLKWLIPQIEREVAECNAYVDLFDKVTLSGSTSDIALQATTLLDFDAEQEPNGGHKTIEPQPLLRRWRKDRTEPKNRSVRKP